MAGGLRAAPASVAIVPARRGSVRLPGKPLLDVAGVPLVLRVLRALSRCGLDRVVLATDYEDIARVAEADGFEAVLTGPAGSGTERVFMAWESLGRPGGRIVNVQGDEPMVARHWLDALLSLPLESEAPAVGTLARPAPPGAETDAGSVKVALGDSGRALRFSRSPVPGGASCFLEHIGVYCFTPESLKACAESPPTRLSRAESLEQLAWMEAGIALLVAQGDFEGIGVDTPEDLERAVRHFDTGE